MKHGEMHECSVNYLVVNRVKIRLGYHSFWVIIMIAE